MNFTIIQNVLWAAGGIANAVLLVVLIVKRRWREFPIFTSWITFLTVQELALYLISRSGSKNLYAEIYWFSLLLEFFLQVGVVVEMARIVLRPTGNWMREARSRFFLSGLLAILIAVVVVLIFHPSGQMGLRAWEIRGNLFAGFIICELYTAMMAAANRLGLQWGNHVMGLGNGLFFWALVAVAVDALHDVLGSDRWVVTMYNVKGLVWIAATIYWVISFWQPQRERLPLSPEMQQYLVNLHRRVQQDLSKIETASRSQNKL
jgi:hypothetical protein